MSFNMSTFLNRHGLALPIIGVAAIIGLFLATRPLDFLLTNILPDDAFYYFQIARNIADGAGSTFDGLTATNGYHPLWMLLLVPLYQLADILNWGAVIPIRVALIASVLMNIATAVLLYRILSLVTTNHFARATGLLLWCLSPFVIFETMNGLETSLSMLTIAAFFWYAIRGMGEYRGRDLVVLGVLGGLMVLARLDTVFYLMAFLGWYVLSDRRRERFLKGVGIGTIAGLFIGPYLLSNVLMFGMLLTSASGANTLVNHALIAQDAGTGLGATIKAMVYNLNGQLDALLAHTGSTTIALVLLGMAFLLVALGHLRLPALSGRQGIFYAFTIGFALLFLINVEVRWTARTWYFVSFGLFFSGIASVVVDRIISLWKGGVRTGQAVGITALGLVAFLFFVSWHTDVRDRSVGQREMYAAAEWFNANVPTDARIGVFNAGIIGYFTDATVVNLDGLVNNDAYEAMKEKRLVDYMRDVELAYVSDFDIYFDYRYKSFYGEDDIRSHLKERERIQLVTHNRSASGIGIYEFVP